MQTKTLKLNSRRPRISHHDDTRQDYAQPISVADLVFDGASRSPDRIAFSVGVDGRELTYGELATRAARWWALLLAAGIDSGRRVALRVADPLSFASSYLGLMASGVTAVPLDPRTPSDEVARRLDLLEIDLLVTDLPFARASQVPIWQLDTRLGELTEVRGTLRLRPFLITPQPALLLPGSSAAQRVEAVPLAEGQLLYVAQQVARHHRLQPTDRGYAPLPLCDVAAQVGGLLATLLSGGSLVLDGRFQDSDYWDIVDSWGVTWLDMSPSMLASLAVSHPPAERTTRRLRFARTAGSPSPAAFDSFQHRTGVSVLETYGLPEAAGQVAANPLRPPDRRAGSVGLPVGVQVRVVDDRRSPRGPGESGSVEIRGPSVVNHYLDAERGRYLPARTPDGWLVTGDLGRLDDDGFLFLTGRPDDSAFGVAKGRHRAIRAGERSGCGAVRRAV